MAGKKQWKPTKKAHKASRWDKARDEEKARTAKTGDNVDPGRYNGHSVGGYSIRKYGEVQARELAEDRTTPKPQRREARGARKARLAALAKQKDNKSKGRKAA